jgi:hypothetical protein
MEHVSNSGKNANEQRSERRKSMKGSEGNTVENGKEAWIFASIENMIK